MVTKLIILLIKQNENNLKILFSHIIGVALLQFMSPIKVYESNKKYMSPIKVYESNKKFMSPIKFSLFIVNLCVESNIQIN